MVRAAGQFAAPEKVVVSMRHVIWSNAIRVYNPVQVTINLYPEEYGVSFVVSTESLIHAQGKIIYGADSSKIETKELDLAALKEQCTESLTQEAIYSFFRSMGVEYGRSFQVIQEIFFSPHAALVRIQLPAHLEQEAEQFVLHPSLLDGALQTIVGFNREETSKKPDLYLPFSIDEIIIFDKLPATCYVYVTKTSEGSSLKFDMQITNETGKVYVHLKDFTVRLLQKKSLEDQAVKALRNRSEEKFDVFYYHPEWKQKAIDEIEAIEAIDEIDQTIKTQHIKDKPKKAKNIILKLNEENLISQLLELNEQNILPRYIIYRVDFSNTIHLKDADIKRQLQKTFHALFTISKTLIQQKPKKDIQILCVSKGKSPFVEAISGLAKTLHLEQPKLTCKVIEIENELNEDTLLKEFNSNDVEVYYDKNYIRWVKYYKEVKDKHDFNSTLVFKSGGVYLITGGAGGLGLIFARYLAEHYQAKLILIGRSAQNEKQKTIITELEKLGGEAIYIQADVTKYQSLSTLMQTIKERFGRLQGVIHSAGVIRDSFILKKTAQEIEEVLAPKILGAVHIDKITQSDPLDFFVMFSSVAGVFGNVGQSDYAYANAWMDAYAFLREEIKKENSRSGKTISINWPLWVEGGMQIDDESLQIMENIFGISKLETNRGLLAFQAVLNQNYQQQIVLSGQKQKIEKTIGIISNPIMPVAEKIDTKISSGLNDEFLINKVQERIVALLVNILKIEEAHIKPKDKMSDYGMDSVKMVMLTNQLNSFYSLQLTPTILYEQYTIYDTACRLVEKYKSIFNTYYLKFGIPGSSNSSESKTRSFSKYSVSQPILKTRLIQAKPLHLPVISSQGAEDIAIIGISGIFPGSPDLEQFWTNLVTQKDLITEIPKERWDAYKTEIKWGGFIDRIDKFDAGFFNISPREAELMDPQQRLFLETVWKTIEDAGYVPEELSANKTGLFVGVSSNDYSELLQQSEISAYTPTGNAHCILANRVSYLLNLTGPSIAIDTACSSSLVALHQAVESILNKNCELAIVGGVNAILSPMLHIAFSKAEMLSKDGRCKTFDKSANGYVRGEGVGAILIKPLQKALQDGDTIYGVIKATAVNHGGHVSSLTVPNPNAQAELIVSAMERSHIAPDTISFIETHGTGTSLGDPIEVNGLKKAFDI